eukprot:scaffold417320_cov44-Prasinocladus_malaysianus.AAC.1
MLSFNQNHFYLIKQLNEIVQSKKIVHTMKYSDNYKQSVRIDHSWRGQHTQIRQSSDGTSPQGASGRCRRPQHLHQAAGHCGPETAGSRPLSAGCLQAAGRLAEQCQAPRKSPPQQAQLEPGLASFGKGWQTSSIRAEPNLASL